MNFPQNAKSVLIMNATVATNADSTAAIDTQGFRHCRLAVYSDKSTAPTTLKVEHSDDATTYTSMNLVGGTDFSLVTNNSSASTAPHYVFDVSLQGRKRYLKVTYRQTTASGTGIITATLGNPALGLAMTASGVSANGAVATLPA